MSSQELKNYHNKHDENYFQSNASTTHSKSIAELTKTYKSEVLDRIGQLQNELIESSETIASDAHRLWGNKIEEICPKYTYKTRLEGNSYKDQGPLCTGANIMVIKDFSNSRGGIFCATKANDQDKQKCRAKLAIAKIKNISVYTTEQSDKLSEISQKLEGLSNFQRNFIDTQDTFFGKHQSFLLK